MIHIGGDDMVVQTELVPVCMNAACEHRINRMRAEVVEALCIEIHAVKIIKLHHMLIWAMRFRDYKQLLRILNESNVSTNTDLCYFFWYEDEPVFLQKEPFYDIYCRLCRKSRASVSITALNNRASQLFSQFLKKAYRIDICKKHVRITENYRRVDIVFCSSSFHILLQYACFLALYELLSVCGAIVLVDCFMRLTAEQAVLVYGSICDLNIQNKHIIFINRRNCRALKNHVAGFPQQEKVV